MSYFASEAHAEEFRHKLLSAYEGEVDVLMAFVEVFVDHSMKLVCEGRTAYEKGEAQEFIRHIHSIKGSLSQLYLSDLTAKASEIEKDARREGINPGITARFEALARELELLSRWLADHFLGSH